MSKYVDDDLGAQRGRWDKREGTREKSLDGGEISEVGASGNSSAGLSLSKQKQ